MKIVRAYLSHPIRGPKGADATIADMEANNQKATQYGMQLVDSLRKLGIYVDLYVPAIHDEFVTIAYFKKMISEDQILEVDCDIISKRDLMIVYDWCHHLSNGMQVEVDYCIKNNIPAIEVYGDNYHADLAVIIGEIAKFMEDSDEDKPTILC